MTRTDTGRASADQLALILETCRAEDPENAIATDTEILAHTRTPLDCRGSAVPAGCPSTTTAPPTPPR